MADPRPEASQALKSVHALIRQGTFNDQVREGVKKYSDEWKLFPVSKTSMKHVGAVVSAEVFDYYGLYEKAEAALELYEPKDVLGRLQGANPGHEMKYLLWLALAFAQTQHRAERHDDAREIISSCLGILDGVDLEQTRHLGTRARMQLLLGQSQQQLGRFDEATHHFSESTRFSWERFHKKTPKAEYLSPDDPDGPHLDTDAQRAFDACRKLAHWNIAKSMVLGTGRIHYVSGRLTDATACLSTAAALLRTTHDSIHRAYCQLLLAGVERARNAGDPTRLRRVVASMQDGAVGLSKHPWFRIRAHHELAVTYLFLHDLDSAEREIDRLDSSRKNVATDTFQSIRWFCNSTILRSRLMRERGNLDLAIDHARTAFEAARKHGRNQRVPEVEALIALAEGLSRRKQGDDLEIATERLKEARGLALSNPKSAAACTVHLAAVYAEQGQVELARSEMNRWHFEYEGAVEHGFIKRLAEETATRIYRPANNTFAIEGTDWATNERRFTERMIASVGAARTNEAKAKLLNIHPKALQRLRANLKRNPSGK